MESEASKVRGRPRKGEGEEKSPYVFKSTKDRYRLSFKLKSSVVVLGDYPNLRLIRDDTGINLSTLSNMLTQKGNTYYGRCLSIERI